MDRKKEPEIQVVLWDDVRRKVKTINQPLFDIIERLSPDKRHSLIKVRYPFGSTIVDNGILSLPSDKGNVIPFHQLTDRSISRKLSYSSIPLGLLMNKSSEVFVTSLDGRVIPLKLIEPGQFFGLFETADHLFGQRSHPIWSVSSGARSLFMLPKITEQAGIQRLKKEFKFNIEAPKHFSDHWALFSALVNSPNIQPERENWCCEVLFFTDTWFQKGCSNKVWLEFYQFLQSEAWLHAQYARDETDFSLLWLRFSSALTRRNFHPRPYLMCTVRHLINLAKGSMPGFKPADSSQLVAPTSLIQDIYINVYGLKNHLPTLMHPYNFIVHKSGSLYYSLSFPTILENCPKEKNAPTLISDQREIQKFIDVFINTIKEDTNPSRQTLLNQAVFDYYHAEKDIYGEIKESAAVPLEDNAFLEDNHRYPHLKFCTTSPFWRGAIKISHPPSL